jgi:acyl carrier protein
LGEIEGALQEQAGVRQAVVLAREDEPGDKRLVAYVVAEQGGKEKEKIELRGSELREQLKGRLPEYMVPSVYVQMEEMPLTPNGKLDRKRLPKPHAAETTNGYVAPTTAGEGMLCDIWAKALKLEQVGIEDNFFEIGGDSILAIQVITRANKVGFQLSAKHLFQFQTVAQLAKVTIIEPTLPEEQALSTTAGTPTVPSPAPEDFPLAQISADQLKAVLQQVGQKKRRPKPGEPII